MFDNIFAAIEKWMRELLSGMVESNLSTMFTAVNQQTSEIAAQVGQTPQGWNNSIFSMIRNISDSVVIPIAGIIITLILCYELISMLTERNNCLLYTSDAAGTEQSARCRHMDVLQVFREDVDRGLSRQPYVRYCNGGI